MIIPSPSGLTKERFSHELKRQQGRCLGCLRQIDDESANNDHYHRTGRFRGLLCRACNWGMRQLNDNQETLRRLMAYLDRNPDKLLVYLGGTLKNPKIPYIGNDIRALGFDVMDEWWTPGKQADENWQAYEKIRGRSYKEALEGRAARNIYLFDKSYIDLADIFILVMPAGKSGMLELGYAKGAGKQTYLLLDGEDPSRYDIMPNAADKIIFYVEDLINELREQLG